MPDFGATASDSQVTTHTRKADSTRVTVIRICCRCTDWRPWCVTRQLDAPAIVVVLMSPAHGTPFICERLTIDSVESGGPWAVALMAIDTM